MQNRKRDTDVQNRILDSVGEGEGGMFWENSIETSRLSRVKQITSPGWMHETSAQGWCTGKTQRDGMRREAGGGIRMGNTCKSMADSCQCMEKPLQYCKVISLQLMKINGKKNKIKKKKVLSFPGPCMAPISVTQNQCVCWCVCVCMEWMHTFFLKFSHCRGWPQNEYFPNLSLFL